MRRQLVGAVGLALLLIGLPSNYDDLLRWRGWAHSMLGENYAPAALVCALVLFLVWLFWERLFPKDKPAESAGPATTSIQSHEQAGGQTGFINIGGNLTLSQEPPRVENPEERDHRRALEQELLDIGHTFYKSANRWYTAAVERRDADADTFRAETLGGNGSSVQRAEGEGQPECRE